MKISVFHIVVWVCVLVPLAFSRPASSNFQTVSNKDGSSVSVRFFGDEHYHYAETSDGYLVMGDGNGNFVYVGEDGLASEFIAKNVGDRTAEEKAFLQGLNQEAAQKKHQELNGGRFPEDSSLEETSFTHQPLMAYMPRVAGAAQMRTKK